MRVMTSYNRFRPTTGEILALVREAAASRDAVVSDDDVFDNGEHLMVRVVLPGHRKAITKGDYVGSGFALRVAQDVVSVNPYVLRLVCTNGAVLPVAAKETRVERVEVSAPTSSIADFESSVVLNAIKDELDQCVNADTILEWIAQARETAQVDGMSVLSSIFFRLAMRRFRNFNPFLEIAERFRRDAYYDDTAFGLLNAITAMGRDARDPHERWSLEEFGGAFPASVARARAELGLLSASPQAFAQPVA